MTRRSLSILFLTLASLGAGPASAATYYLLRVGDDARTVIDPATIEQAPGSAVRRAPTVTVQRSITSGTPPQPGYVRAVNDYDCAAMKMRWISFAAFSRSGEVLASRENPAPAWEDIAAKSGPLAEWRVACGLSRGDSIIAADGVAKVVVALMAGFDPPPPPVPAAETYRR